MLLWRSRCREAAIAAALLGLAACGPSTVRVDKSGSVRQASQTITLSTGEAGDVELAFFAQDANRLAHGSLKVVVDDTSYPASVGTEEARLDTDLRKGQVRFGYVPARDWAAAGVPAFRALDAPFQITTFSAASRLAMTPLASTVLGQLRSIGLVGIALVPSEPRNITSVAPIFGLDAFRQRHFLVDDNPDMALFIRALGAFPNQGLSGSPADELLEQGTVFGVETAPTFILSNSYNAEAPYLSTYALLVKFDTVVASAAAWRALSPAQRASLQQAAADTVAHAGIVPSTEATELQQLCASGTVLEELPQQQLDTMARAAQAAAPTDPEVRSVMAKIRTTVPGTGPQLLSVPLPPSCPVARTAAEAERLHEGPAPAPTTAPAGPQLPTGIYVATVTAAEMHAAGAGGVESDRSITYTTHLYADGNVVMSQKPDYPDNGTITGRYVVKGNEVTFVWDPSAGLTPESLRWSYLNGRLTLSVVHVQDGQGVLLYSGHPWHKIG